MTDGLFLANGAYVLRLALQEDLPLNEGLLTDVKIVLPDGSFLNPTFHDIPALCPAVVGGEEVTAFPKQNAPEGRST